MYLFCFILALVVSQVKSIYPGLVSDIDAESANDLPYAEDILNLVGNKVKVSYLANIIANPYDLGIPEKVNMSAINTSDPSQTNFDRDSLHCTFGNVMLQYRQVYDFDDTSGERMYSPQHDATMVFSTQIGKETEVALARMRYNLTVELNNSQQTCWPTHGFHLHTGTGTLGTSADENADEWDFSGYHLGPLCGMREFYDIESRGCASCPSGQFPNWDSSVYLRKYEQNQYYDETCGGMQAKFENISELYLGSKYGPYYCKGLVERIQYSDLHGGWNERSPENLIPPKILKCLHTQCAFDIEQEFKRMIPMTAWNFKNLHIGTYHPFSPLECKDPAADKDDRRGECGRCDMSAPDCIKMGYAPKESEDDPDTCQLSMPGEQIYGLHKINSQDYNYSLPEYDETKQTLLMPKNLRFEGPDVSDYMRKSRAQLQHDYCFHMDIEMNCLPPGDIPVNPVPIVELPTVNLYVDGGQNSTGMNFYNFYTSEDCIGQPLEDRGNSTYTLATNTKYIFSRCQNATTHPFNVHPLGSDPGLIGITNIMRRSLSTGGDGKIYEWYCSSHPDIMKGVFVARDHRARALLSSSRRLSDSFNESEYEDEFLEEVGISDYELLAIMENTHEVTVRMSEPQAEVSSRIVTTPDDIEDEIIEEKDYFESNNPLAKMQVKLAPLVKLPTAPVKNIESDAEDRGWNLGERIGGLEYFIGYANSSSHCLSIVKDEYPEANGVTFELLRRRCYAAVNSTAHNDNIRFISYKIFTPVMAPPIGIQLPKEWQFSQMSEPDIAGVVDVVDTQSFMLNTTLFQKGVTNPNTVEFLRMYDFNLRSDLGSIESAVFAIEYLDSRMSMFDVPNKERRQVIVLGVNNKFEDRGKKTEWASLHVVETFGRGTEKSLCLAGFYKKPLKRIHGVAVIPLTQEETYIDLTENMTTFEASNSQIKGRIDEKKLKIDNGLVIASVTDQMGKLNTWISNYNGIPIDASPSNPGSVLVPLEIKWSRYAVHHGDVRAGYLLMSVIEESTNTVYVFDGEIENAESFQVVMGKGIVSSSEGTKYPQKPAAAYTLAIRDMYWTSDEKLIVLTDVNVYVYTRIREDLPWAICQNQKRQPEIVALVPPGHYWSLTKTCEIKTKACSAGSFETERGQQSCKKCPAGKFQPGEGRTSCIDCARGKFQFLEGQTSCDDCMPGFFSPPGYPGLAPGEHESIMLDYTCESCPKGYFSMEKGAYSCKKCRSEEHCDIKSQIFPHTECTPDTDEWESFTDHVHEFCCSGEGFYDDFFNPDMSLAPDWRQRPYIYCVKRRKIKIRPPRKDCGDLSQMITEALDKSVESTFTDKLNDFDFENAQPSDLEDLDYLADTIGELYDQDFGNASIGDQRVALQANYTLNLIENITAEYIECVRSDINRSFDDFIFDSVELNASNTSSYSMLSALPDGVMLVDPLDKFANATFDPEKGIENITKEYGMDIAQCYASLEYKTIHIELESCCSRYVDINPNLMKDGKFNVQPGDDLYCLEIYDAQVFEKETYNPANFTLEDTTDEPIGCMIRNGMFTNFHPLMDEIMDCCPSAREDILNSSWNTWDFINEPSASATCYVSEDGDCYMNFTYYNEDKMEMVAVPAFVEDGKLCREENFSYVPKIVEVEFQEECYGDWDMERFSNDRYFYSTQSPCPSGWNASSGQTEYQAINNGTCADIGFEPVPYDDCYEYPELWKDYFATTQFDELLWQGFPEFSPVACTVNRIEENTECANVYPLGSDEVQRVCETTYVNKEYSADEIDSLFEYNATAIQQNCSEQHPCLCQRNTTCEKLDTVCSPENPCVCSQNTTECVYVSELNITSCECEEMVEVPAYRKTDIFVTSFNSEKIFYAKQSWYPHNYDLVNGIEANFNSLVTIKDTWLNVSKEELPVGVASSEDRWEGFYDDEYLYQITKHSANEMLINMKGGIDWEATRGTDEFRYCRHEFETTEEETFEFSENAFNVTANETYLVKVNRTIEKASYDAIYCSSFFPIVRQADDGSWTCSSVKECPYWEFWPPEINQYGFVETDPCICDGIEQYGGYCIPDMKELLPKKGAPLQELFSSPAISAALSNDGSTVIVRGVNSIQAYTLDPNQQKGQSIVTGSGDNVVLSGDGQTFARTYGAKVEIYGMGDPSWAKLAEFSGAIGPIAISKDGKTVVAASSSGVKVFTVVNNVWQIKGGDITSSDSVGHLDVSEDGLVIAFSAGSDAFVYEWLNNDWQQRGESIDIGEPSFMTFSPGRVALTDDGSTIVVSDPVGEEVSMYRWDTVSWKKRTRTDAPATHGLDISSDGLVILTCSEDVRLYEYKRGRMILSVNISEPVSSCSLSSDASTMTLSKQGQISVQATGLEADVYQTKEVWATDVDQLFIDPQYRKYVRDCGVGSIMKANTEYDITKSIWWEDAFERSCLCQNQLCSGYAAHDLLVGLSNDLKESSLLTMTCANDGCVFDEIDANRWTVAEEFAKDCTGATNEVCGVYSFGRFSDRMPFEPLFGVYDERGDVNTGMFKCPHTNGMRRNNFNSEISHDTMYLRDGDFDVAPNGKPLYCACAAEICQFNQYCKIADDGSGFCGNTRLEVKSKLLDSSILSQCVQMPEVIEFLDLSLYAAPEACVCNGRYCNEGEFCTSERCRECVCQDGEYEHVEGELSTCKPITDCEMGEYVSTVQTRYTDRHCTQCVNGVTYSPFQNAHSCETCRVCKGEIISACNVTHDTVCGLECPNGQGDWNGVCMPVCTVNQHRLPNGTCIGQCDYGTYFDTDECVECPEDHFTQRRGRDISKTQLKFICYPHTPCNLNTHFYAEAPSKSREGRCIRRYQGHCATRIPGNETTDDTCIQDRNVLEGDLFLAHADEYNQTVFWESNRRLYIETFGSEAVSALEILETSRNIGSTATVDILSVVSRYIYRELPIGFIDANINKNTTRIFSHVSSASAELFNFPTPFSLTNVPQNIEKVFFTWGGDIDIDEGPFQCQNLTNYQFSCVIV